MILELDDLRSACRSLLALSGDSIAGYGTAAFLNLDGGTYLVSGSQRSKMGGVKFDKDFDPELFGLWFDVRGLHQFLSASFAQVTVNVEMKASKIEFRVGRNYRRFLVKPVTSVGQMLSVPKPVGGVNVAGLLEMARVAHMAHKNQAHMYSGVYVAMQNGYAQMLALDGFSVGYVWGQTDNPDVSMEFVVPSDIMLLARNLNWEGTPQLMLLDNAIWFMDEKRFLTSPKMAGDFPGKQIIEVVQAHGGENPAKVSVVELFDKMDALANIQREKNISAMTFNFCEEGLILSVGEPEQGEGRFYIDSDDIGHQFLVNGHSVKSAGALIKDMGTTPTLLFSPHDTQQWLVMRPIEGNAIFCLALMEF
jgi:hypothetical protein